MNNWTPVRKGKIYCSTSCGGKCTFAAFSAATENAARLASLLGPGWTPHVWENLGWHYSAENEKAKAEVHRHDQTAGYTLYWNVTPQIVLSARSLPSLMAQARDRVDSLVQSLNNLSSKL